MRKTAPLRALRGQHAAGNRLRREDKNRRKHVNGNLSYLFKSGDAGTSLRLCYR